MRTLLSLLLLFSCGVVAMEQVRITRTGGELIVKNGSFSFNIEIDRNAFVDWQSVDLWLWTTHDDGSKKSVSIFSSSADVMPKNIKDFGQVSSSLTGGEKTTRFFTFISKHNKGEVLKNLLGIKPNRGKKFRDLNLRIKLGESFDGSIELPFRKNSSNPQLPKKSKTTSIATIEGGYLKTSVPLRGNEQAQSDVDGIVGAVENSLADVDPNSSAVQTPAFRPVGALDEVEI